MATEDIDYEHEGVALRGYLATDERRTSSAPGVLVVHDAGDWQMIVYGNTGHSFTNPGADAMKRPGFFYQALSDARSWAQMRAFFEEIFAG